MKTFGMVLMVVAMLMGSSAVGMAKNRTVKGDVVKIDGDFVEVKDAKGQIQNLHTDKTTKRVGEIVVGSTIKATMTRDGHAKKITVVVRPVVVPPNVVSTDTK